MSIALCLQQLHCHGDVAALKRSREGLRLRAKEQERVVGWGYGGRVLGQGIHARVELKQSTCHHAKGDGAYGKQ